MRSCFPCGPTPHPGNCESVPETEMLRFGLVALDVEHLGVGEGVGIAVRRGTAQKDRFARGNYTTTDACFFEGVADVVLDRPFVAQQFFHCGRDLAAIVVERCHWSGLRAKITTALPTNLVTSRRQLRPKAQRSR